MKSPHAASAIAACCIVMAGCAHHSVSPAQHSPPTSRPSISAHDDLIIDMLAHFDFGDGLTLANMSDEEFEDIMQSGKDVPERIDDAASPGRAEYLMRQARQRASMKHRRRLLRSNARTGYPHRQNPQPAPVPRDCSSPRSAAAHLADHISAARLPIAVGPRLTIVTAAPPRIPTQISIPHRRCHHPPASTHPGLCIYFRLDPTPEARRRRQSRPIPHHLTILPRSRRHRPRDESILRWRDGLDRLEKYRR